MLTTRLVGYLAPYLPAQALTLLSIIGFALERILVPRIQDVYSNASLDPHTLLPFIFTAIALYLTFVSIYHALRASARLVWFGTKWSIVIIGLWFILGAVNDVGRNYRGLNQNHNRDRTSSYSNWWKKKDHQESLIEPIKLFITQTMMDPTSLFESFFSPIKPATSSSSSSSHQPKDTRSSSSRKHAPVREDQDGGPLSGQRVWEFVVQNVREPMVALVREAKLKNNQREQDSRTRNR